MDKLEIKAAFTTDDAGELTGLAWPFGTPDRVGDVIEPKAFNSPAVLPMLFGHDQNEPVGVWDAITETDQGLEVRGRLLIETVARAREIHSLIREKALTGLSIGFVTMQASPRRGGGRTITALDLLEISVVSVPSHPGARITSAKSEPTPSIKHQGNSMEPEAHQIAIDAIEAKMAARLDQLEAKLNRPAVDNGNTQDVDAERKAFVSFARRGVERMPADEVKNLTVAVDASAGFLAPESFASEIIKLTSLYSPIRNYARVMQIGASEVKIPRRVSGPTASWTGETANRTASTPIYDQVSLTPHELATYIDVSNALLEDNAYDLEAELAADLAEAFGIAEGAAFVSGDGTGKPKGLLAAVSAEVKTGAAANFASSNPADVLFSAFHAIPGVHAQNGVWLMNRTTLGTVRKWKDGQGRYLVADPIAADAPTTLLGRPIVEATDMPNVGAGNSPIVFGDLSAYRIVDRVQLAMLRDPFSTATTGQVRFHARKRVGGDMTHSDRLVRILVSA
jgi:HK97 family phage major capsid protein/HK97 family phage prohead protease